MKIAMFGGSFDPIHKGHVQLAHAFVEKLGLDKVLIIPTYIPPHKQKGTNTTPEQRLEMCRLAFENDDMTEVSDIEIRRQGASFTYQTLQQLSQLYPEAELYLITGADMFMTIQSWRNPEIIFSLATVCGVPRNDDDIADLTEQQKALSGLGARTVIMDAGVMTVSSTEVRKRIKRNEDISELVPAPVADYIFKNGLYV